MSWVLVFFVYYFMLIKYEGVGRFVKRLMSRIIDVLVNNLVLDDFLVLE